jgi:hypothetical protein
MQLSAVRRGGGSNRLISDAAASAYGLRIWLAHDVARIVTGIFWQTYPPGDALDLVKGLARSIADAVGGLDCSSDQVARQMLVDEYRRQRHRHEATSEAIQAAVLDALRAGLDRKAVEAAVKIVVKEQTLAPPPWLVTQAKEDAAAEFRIAEDWWTDKAKAA